MRIAVAGGTGVVGRHTVDAVRATGHEPVVLARSVGVDLVTGKGLAAALDGVEAVIDVSNKVTTRRKPAEEFFAAATGNLLTVGAAAGVEHLVVLSIVGVDEVGLGYYQAKLRQEQLALAGPLPVTVLRATQFHEFPGQYIDRSPGPVMVVPRWRTQPVAAREVGALLVEHALAEPVGMAPEVGGPEVFDMADLVRRVLRRRGLHRLVVEIRLPGEVGRGLASGALTASGSGPRGTQTFSEWLQRGEPA
jgi:uncharacterized protein YbjT (DUF2867 family)